jgi:uncharacterized protein
LDQLLFKLLLEFLQPPYWELLFTAGSRRLSRIRLVVAIVVMLRVTNTTRGITVGDKVELADTSLKRMFGLLGRRGLDAGGGLWIRPSSGVHTFGMAFSIDVVGLDRDLRVIKLWSCLVPYRLTSVSFKLKSVLELPCGAIAQSQMQVGDQLEILDAAG